MSGLALLLCSAMLPLDPPPSACAEEPATASPLEARFLSQPVQVTAGMSKAGEGYFSPDAGRICYQAVPDGYPFYQIYVQDFDAAAIRPATPRRVSPGRGRTTCSWFSPDGNRLLFASSHLDPEIDATETRAREQAEEDRRTGRRRRYQWDFDPCMDIFTARLDGTDLVRLTRAPGYDAECSFSPDGKRILFVSDRDGDPDIYVMDADGGNVRQLTNAPGYDGGPFFSPDGLWITYRTDRMEKDMLQIHVMRADGSGDTAITSGRGVRSAPTGIRVSDGSSGREPTTPIRRPGPTTTCGSPATWPAMAAFASGRRCGSPTTRGPTSSQSSLLTAAS